MRGLRKFLAVAVVLIAAPVTAEDLPLTVEQSATEAAVSAPQISLEVTRSGQLELAASQQLATGRAAQALKSLAAVNAAQRSAEFKALLLQVLEGCLAESDSAAVFTEPAVRNLLQDTAVRDTLSDDRFAAFFSSEVRKAAKVQAVEKLERFYDLVVAARPDPDAENDALRFEIALSAESEELREFAQGRVDELEAAGALGPWRRLRLLLSGYWGRGPMVLFVIVSVLAILGLALVFLRLVGRTELVSSGRDSKAHRGPAYAVPNLADDEYSELLKAFGLTDQASEEEIKTAYRRLIRDYHPDTSSIRTRDNLDDGALARKFNELKGKYERILEIRKGFFGG